MGNLVRCPCNVNVSILSKNEHHVNVDTIGSSGKYQGGGDKTNMEARKTSSLAVREIRVSPLPPLLPSEHYLPLLRAA